MKIVKALTYLLIACSRVLLEKPTGFQLVKKFPTFYGTRRFITAFTICRHLSLPWATLIQSIPSHPISWRYTLILSSHLCLGLPSGLFLSGFPTKPLYTPLLSPIQATCSAHLIVLDLITRTILGEKYRSLSSSLCIFFHSPVTSSLLDQLFSSAAYLKHPQPTFHPHCKRPSFTPIQDNRSVKVLVIKIGIIAASQWHISVCWHGINCSLASRIGKMACYLRRLLSA